MAIFGVPSSTPGGDRHVRPLSFLREIWFLATFIWSVFRYNRYFWQRLVCEPAKEQKIYSIVLLGKISNEKKMWHFFNQYIMST